MRLVKRRNHNDRLEVLQKGLSLIRLLVDRRFGVTIKDMMRELCVSRRNVYRYLDALAGVGVNFKKEQNPASRCREHVWRIVNRQEWIQMRAIL